ncbi:MAG: hypothetical protein Q9186_005595 [Xanthomendoza sp. 1 TL-2023]
MPPHASNLAMWRAMIRLLKLSTRISLARQAISHICLLLSAFIFVSVFYRRYWLDADDPYKCRALFTRGHWLDPPEESYTSQHFGKWQPSGCMMHEYTGNDVRACLKSQQIIYIGDSTTRQLFWATAKKLDKTVADDQMRGAGKHEDLTFEDKDVTVDFIWDPFLNSSTLRRDLLPYDTSEDADTVETGGLITIGGGLWYARHFGSDSLDHFRNTLDYVIPLVADQRYTNFSQYSPLSSAQPRNGGHHLYLTPVEIPLYNVLSPSRDATITPDKVNPMNEYLYNLSTTKGVKVPWSYSLMTWGSDLAYDESGLHVIENVATRRVDILLNMRCNAQMTLLRGYPFERTCCSAYEKPQPSRIRFFLPIFFITPVVIGISSYGTLYTKSDPNFDRRRRHRISTTSWAFATLSMVLTYCVLADRTQLFNKAQKHFTYQDFSSLCTFVLILGLASVRRSLGRTLPGGGHQVANEWFLPRDQTDEWKGWMQFAILIYHYTGASSVLGIYQVIRILVASYLFMTGYGNTHFFYKKQDYSLKRCASVLVGINLLSCILPHVMDSEYLFYYFAPLVSFWYLVVYWTLRIGHSKNGSMPFLLGKIGVSVTIVTVLIRCPIFFDGLFLLLRYTCKIHWNVKEWRFRLQLDCYIVYVGMLAAIATCRIHDIVHGQLFPQDHFARLIRRHWNKIRLLSIAAAVIIIPSFWSFTQQFSNKADYNRWVPYISLFPIFTFIILRNCNRHLRNFYSWIFAWLGQCSLETFTLQYHIWLAADTKGLLSLGVFGRNGTHLDGRHHDFAVLTVVFLWVSALTADATTTITKWIVDPKAMYVPETELIPLPRRSGAFSNLFERLYDVWKESLKLL